MSLRQGRLVHAELLPAANNAFDLAASQPHVGQRAIIELLQRIDVAPQAPLGSEAVCKPGGLVGEIASDFASLRA
jgi:hypothetical protein